MAFGDDRRMDNACCWCGKPGIFGETIVVVHASRRDVMWVHPNCERLSIEHGKKSHEDFFTNEIPKFVRGEPSGITPGTLGEHWARIAKKLIATNPSLALPEKVQELIAAVESYQRKHAEIIDGDEEVPSDEGDLPDSVAVCPVLPSVDELVIEIIARDEGEPGYAAAVARGIMKARAQVV